MLRPATVITLLLAAATPRLLVGQEAAPLPAYLYDKFSYAVPCPAPYAFSDLMVFAYLPVGELSNSQDLAVGPDGDLYIADAGNGRVLRLGRDGELHREYRDPALVQPVGIFVEETRGDVYVADGSSQRIFRFDARGTLLASVPPPSSEVLPEQFIYAPARILVDKRGWIYVIGTGTSRGIIQLDGSGAFQGFFGANRAPDDPVRRLLRRFMSDAMKEAQLMQVLQPYTDFELGLDGYLYTVTETLPTNQIRRLNPLGLNTYPDRFYGERYANATRTEMLDPHLAAIEVDDRGVVTVLDRITGRIFQYNQDGDLLFIFGGLGEQRGSFIAPVSIAIDRRDRTLYVLDPAAGTVQVFTPTPFADEVARATTLTSDGRYEEALAGWDRIRRLDASYPLAHKGIAKTLLRLGERLGDRAYLAASMAYSRYAGDRRGFSEAFALRRQLWLLDNFVWVIAGLAAAGLLAWLAVRFVRLPAGARDLLAPLAQALTHPYRTMERVKWEMSGRLAGSATIMVLLLVAARLVQMYGTSYHFTAWDPERISVLTEATRLLLPLLSWCAANALVTAVLAGEGRLRQIYCFSALALSPAVAGMLLLTLASHVLTLSEGGIAAGITLVSYTWSGMLMLLGINVVHDYRLGKTIGVAAVSVFVIVLLWGASVLIVGLVGSVVRFVTDILRELALRA